MYSSLRITRDYRNLILDLLFQNGYGSWKKEPKNRYSISLLAYYRSPDYKPLIDFINIYFPDYRNDIILGKNYIDEEGHKRKNLYIPESMYEKIIKPEIDFYIELEKLEVLDIAFGTPLEHWRHLKEEILLIRDKKIDAGLWPRIFDVYEKSGFRPGRFFCINSTIRIRPITFYCHYQKAYDTYHSDEREKDSASQISKLIEDWGNLTKKEYRGSSKPIFSAISEGQYFLAKILIESKKFDLNEKDEFGDGLLHILARSYYFYECEELL